MVTAMGVQSKGPKNVGLFDKKINIRELDPKHFSFPVNHCYIAIVKT